MLAGCGDQKSGDQPSGTKGGDQPAELQPSADAFTKAVRTAVGNGGFSSVGFASVSAKGAEILDEKGQSASSTSKSFA